MKEEPKRKSNWMNGFIVAPPSTPAQRLENEQRRLLANRRSNNKRGGD